jgi:hypothetical protein
MQIRIRTHTGAIVLLSGLPAWAQSGTQTGVASTAASSPPEDPPKVKTGDPVWFIAGFVTGFVAGVVAFKAFGGSNSGGQGSSQR